MLLEVRPSEGGDDAVVFARQLRSALITYAGSHGCAVGAPEDTERTYVNDVDCPHLKAFVGTHRIQRIPRNDKRGRRHTSTASVALVANFELRSSNFVEGDVEFIVARGSGPGGQHRNKTESAVTARHIPTGIEAHCEDSRSQWSNKERALEELQRRLDAGLRAQGKARQQEHRRGQILTGERPVKAFTWNDQRDEVLDHEGGRRWRLRDALKGKFGPVE